MNPLFLLVPALLVVAAVAYGVTRALARVWHEHAIKIALLERLETHPDLVPSYQELEKLVERISTTKPPLKQDLTVTGIILTLIGLSSVIGGQSFNMGRVSAGIHVGGLVCVGLGFVLALVGLLLRNVTAPPPPSEKADD